MWMFIVNFVFSAGTISSFYGTVDDVEYKYHTNNNIIIIKQLNCLSVRSPLV